MGRYYEEFQLGERLTGASRTVTDLEIALLPTVMGALNPLFLDEETARQSTHGGRILYGPALLGIAIGLTEEIVRGTLVGLLGIDRLRFARSVRAGDTITAHAEVIGLRPTSRPERGILQLRDWVTNQRGETVLELERSILLLRQPTAFG